MHPTSSNRRSLNEIISNNIWLHILPSLDRAQLGLNLALVSDRLDALVDSHFDQIGLSFDRISIRRPSRGMEPQMESKGKFFEVPTYSLRNNIRFERLNIWYIDQTVIAFLRNNTHTWGDNIKLTFDILLMNQRKNEAKQIWDMVVEHIWPLFSTNIRHLNLMHLNTFRRRISPTILTDLPNISTINSMSTWPDPIGDDAKGASAEKALAKWLHKARTDGQANEMICQFPGPARFTKWLNKYKEEFLRSSTLANYKIIIQLEADDTPNEPFEFELVNERTHESLALQRIASTQALIRRCPIGEALVHTTEESDMCYLCFKV